MHLSAHAYLCFVIEFFQSDHNVNFSFCIHTLFNIIYHTGTKFVELRKQFCIKRVFIISHLTVTARHCMDNVCCKIFQLSEKFTGFG